MTEIMNDDYINMLIKDLLIYRLTNLKYIFRKMFTFEYKTPTRVLFFFYLNSHCTHAILFNRFPAI